MSEQSTNPRLTAIEKRHEELMGYIDKFETAFDELHQAVVRYSKTPGQYISPHHDYPIMSILDSGFPSFHEAGFYRDSAPRDYVSILRPRGLVGLLSGYERPKVGFPKGAELAEYLRTHDIGKRLNLKGHVYEGKASDGPVDRLVGDAVERYLQLHGLDETIEPQRRTEVIMPILWGTVTHNLSLRLVAPITMTHFDVDHFPLSESTYITRIPKKLQLARARMSTRGTGAVQMVVNSL